MVDTKHLDASADVVRAVNKEIIGIDIIRFLCALSVMISHFYPHMFDGSNWIGFLGAGGVAVFFVISGFVIPFSAEGKSCYQFIQSRIVRLVPGVWICATLSLLAALLINGIHAEEGLWGKYLRTIFFVPVMPGNPENLGKIWIEGMYWTLFVEISFYAIVTGLLLVNKFRWIARLSTLLGAASLIYWVTFFGVYLYDPASPFSQAIVNTGFKRYLDLLQIHHGAWFGLGINIWLLTKNYKFSERGLSLALCLAGGLLQVSHNALFQTHISPLAIIAYTITGVALILLAVFWRKARQTFSDNVKSTCRWIGLTTYPLYLVHNRIGLSIIDGLSEHGVVGKVGAVILAALLMITLAFLIARFVEPVLQKLFRAVLRKVGTALEGSRFSFFFIKTRALS